MAALEFNGPESRKVPAGQRKTDPKMWENFYKYLTNTWFSKTAAEGAAVGAGNQSAAGAQPSDLGLVGVQDSGMAMATANLIQRRKQQQEEMLRQMDAGNGSIINSPTVR